MYDELWPGGPKFEAADGVFPVGTDSVLLSDFVCSTIKGRAMKGTDLGCGAGVVSILLAWDNPRLIIEGLDIDPEAVRAARRNIEACGLNERVSASVRDIRELEPPAGTCDIVVANPPYYAVGRGRAAPDERRARARGESSCTLQDVCRAAGYLTRWGGAFALVHKPERLAEIFRELNEYGLEPKRLRFVHHKSHSPPSLVLIEARRGGKPSLTIEAPLILANGDGGDSSEVKRIYHRD